MPDEIQVGNYVQHKTGGPTMVVDEIGTVDGVKKAWCSWIDGSSSKFSREVFPLTSLVKRD